MMNEKLTPARTGCRFVSTFFIHTSSFVLGHPPRPACVDEAIGLTMIIDCMGLPEIRKHQTTTARQRPDSDAISPLASTGKCRMKKEE
jgi:hypothetical protein